MTVGIKTIAAIILIAIILIILSGGASVIFGKFKYIEKFIPGLDEKEESFTDKTAKQISITNFNTFIENIKECKDTENKNCVCNSDLDLPTDYKLKVMKDKIILFRERSEIGEGDFSMPYILNENMICEFEEFTINFGKNDMKIDKLLWDIHFHKDNDLRNKLIYKSGDKFCWITEKITRDKLISINFC